MSEEESLQLYRVTERPFSEILRLSCFNLRVLRGLVPGSIIVEVGSGINQEFANGLMQIRRDIAVVSIDPSLAILASEAKINLTRSKGTGRRTLDYYLADRVSDVHKNSAGIQLTRLENARRTRNVIPALAPNFPFEDSSVKWVVDVYGPGTYFRERKILIDYLTEISRILQVGGRASIYPLIAEIDIGQLFGSLQSLQITEYRRTEVEYNEQGDSRTIRKSGIRIERIE
ncbi:MAG: hypothetical protein PHS44_06640 [Candidatus Dojkabacteria bacterium]|jgi:hypothetical protein|nr:hypothetical protein [Candidatus Dojkabacteria bacterium]